MRRAARISMYRGITHLRQIISSLNYIFPRRASVAGRVYFAFTSSIDENKNRISRPFSASPLHRLRAAVSRSCFALCKLPLSSVTNFYTRHVKKKCTCQGRREFLNRSHSSSRIRNAKYTVCKKPPCCCTNPSDYSREDMYEIFLSSPKAPCFSLRLK